MRQMETKNQSLQPLIPEFNQNKTFIEAKTDMLECLKTTFHNEI